MPIMGILIQKPWCYFAKRIAAVCFNTLVRKILWACDLIANYNQLQPLDFSTTSELTTAIVLFWYASENHQSVFALSTWIFSILCLLANQAMLPKWKILSKLSLDSLLPLRIIRLKVLLIGFQSSPGMYPGLNWQKADDRFYAWTE